MPSSLLQSVEMELARLKRVTDQVTEISVNEIIEKYFDDSSLSNGETPKFVLITGGPGSGKTTQRKMKYSTGYVLIDAGDVFKNICKGNDLAYQFGEDFVEALEAIGQLIANRAIEEKRNIVMEIIGDKFDVVTAIVEAMKNRGYDAHLEAIYCDVAEAYERHLKGAYESLSSYFSEPYHTKWLLAAAKK
jgi:2-phosphoglycerate kinase